MLISFSSGAFASAVVAVVAPCAPPGFRSYPFLGQVCKRWEALLATSLAQVRAGSCCVPLPGGNPYLHSQCVQSMVWQQLVVDFGHELVTAIHTPLIWSNQRPTPEDFSNALNQTNLSVSKV